MTISYTIAAEENYDAATVATGFTPGNFYTDQANPGYGYDRVNRVILYGCAISAAAGETNGTGHDWWTGENVIASGATYDGTSYANHSIMVRPLDLPSSVTNNSCFGAALTVPAGTTASQSIQGQTLNSGGSGYTPGTYTMIACHVVGTAQWVMMNCTVSAGGAVTTIAFPISYKATIGDVITVTSGALGPGSGFQATVSAIDSFKAVGTERRATSFDNTALRNGNLFVDPNTGNLWAHTNAPGVGVPSGVPCLLYILRKSASYALEISPMFPFDNTDRHMDLRGETNNYAYTLQYPNAAGGATFLVGSPRDIQAAETAVDFKLPYFWFSNPVDINPDNAGYFMSATCFSTNNKIYQLASVVTGARNFALYRFDEPSAASPFNTATTGGGFTTITPWTSSTGPNTNISGYNTANSGGTRQRLWYLPATNNLVAITAGYPQDRTSGHQSDFFLDCTYIGTPDGTATFDYHAKFVTGFVDINFAPLAASGTNVAPANSAYAVIDVQDVNTYLNTTSFHYTDGNAATDYVQRWLVFTVLKCNPGDTIVPPASVLSANVNYFTVLVKYSFVSGSAPAIVASSIALTPETGWDTQLPLNSDFGGFPTGNAVALLTNNENGSQAISGDYYSDGVWDAATTSFWFSGQAPQMWGVSSNFLSRRNANRFNPSPPFLRLGFGGIVSKRPTSQGYIF